jgi:hypothetical protein
MKILYFNMFILIFGLAISNNSISAIGAKTKPPTSNVQIIAAIGAKTKPPTSNLEIIAAIGAKSKLSNLLIV